MRHLAESSETALAWISTERNSPHTMLAQTPILESFRPWDYYAKRCADNPISRRHLVRRLHDSGHFRDPRGEKTSRRALYRCTDLPNDWREIPESCESLSDPDVRPFPFRVAVGARVTPRPPHRSVRAPLCIRLLPRVPDGETLVRPGMKDSRLWEPVVRQLRHSSPGETAFLTAPAECPAPAFGDLGSKGPR